MKNKCFSKAIIKEEGDSAAILVHYRLFPLFLIFYASLFSLFPAVTLMIVEEGTAVQNGLLFCVLGVPLFIIVNGIIMVGNGPQKCMTIHKAEKKIVLKNQYPIFGLFVGNRTFSLDRVSSFTIEEAYVFEVKSRICTPVIHLYLSTWKRRIKIISRVDLSGEEIWEFLEKHTGKIVNVHSTRVSVGE